MALSFGSVIFILYLCCMRLLFYFILFSFISSAQITEITNQPNWEDNPCIDCMLYICNADDETDCGLYFMLNSNDNFSIYFIDNGIPQIVKLKSREIIDDNYQLEFENDKYYIFLSSIDIGYSIKRGGEIFVYRGENLIYKNKDITLTF